MAVKADVEFLVSRSTMEQGPGVRASATRGARWEMVLSGVELSRWLLSKVAPYLAVELLLPGGTLIALLMYLRQRRARSRE